MVCRTSGDPVYTHIIGCYDSEYDQHWLRPSFLFLDSFQQSFQDSYIVVCRRLKILRADVRKMSKKCQHMQIHITQSQYSRKKKRALSVSGLQIRLGKMPRSKKDPISVWQPAKGSPHFMKVVFQSIKQKTNSGRNFVFLFPRIINIGHHSKAPNLLFIFHGSYSIIHTCTEQLYFLL